MIFLIWSIFNLECWRKNQTVYIACFEYLCPIKLTNKKNFMIQILNWRTGAVIFEGDYPTIKDAVEAAVKQRVSLAYADLEGANLEDANLEDADLENANLEDANLYKAKLAWADLTGANLTGADLTGANLTNAILIDTIVAGTILEKKD